MVEAVPETNSHYIKITEAAFQHEIAVRSSAFTRHYEGEFNQTATSKDHTGVS